MPRRNRNNRQRKRPFNPARVPEHKIPSYTAMARSLVERGLASMGILESTVDSPRHHTSHNKKAKRK